MQHFLQLNRRDSAAQKPALNVQKPGDEMGYSYDLGDHWMHDIRLISLLPAEESNGRCLVRLLGWFHLQLNQACLMSATYQATAAAKSGVGGC